MKSSRLLMVAVATLTLLCSLPNLAAAQTASDNSAQNKSQTQTADNQSNTKSDRMTTANVRKAIMADKDLSVYGHNVKIITLNGAVTLEGPVKSEEEKQKIATDVAGVISPDKLTNNLTVKQ